MDSFVVVNHTSKANSNRNTSKNKQRQYLRQMMLQSSTSDSWEQFFYGHPKIMHQPRVMDGLVQQLKYTQNEGFS